MNTNTKLPAFRLPCFLNGELHYLPLSHFQGTSLILSCISHVTEQHAWIFESQSTALSLSQGPCALVLHQTFPSTENWTTSLHKIPLPIVLDPLKRLGRALRISHDLPHQRCESYLFDRNGVMCLRIFHDLTSHAISTVLNVSKRNSDLHSHSNPLATLAGLKPQGRDHCEPTYNSHHNNRMSSLERPGVVNTSERCA